jgi:hypothetical protein
MPDNPNKKGQDRKFVSQQTHEQAYQKRKAAKGKNEEGEKSGRGSERGSGKGRSGKP